MWSTVIDIFPFEWEAHFQPWCNAVVFFCFEPKKIFIRKCSTFIYNPQALPGSLKFRTWCFSLTLYTEYEAIQALKISMTRLDTVLKQLHISLWNILIFHWKIFYLHLQSSSASKKWKNANVLRFADLVHRVRRDPSVTLRNFHRTQSSNN